MCVESASTLTTTGRIESWHRLRHANNLSPRPRNLRRLRRVHVDPRVQDRVQLLRHFTPVAQHSSVDVTSSTIVAGRLAGVVAPGLWQRDARRVSGTLCHPASLRLRHSDLQASSENASVCHVIPLIFPNCAHRILFCYLTLKSVL